MKSKSIYWKYVLLKIKYIFLSDSYVCTRWIFIFDSDQAQINSAWSVALFLFYPDSLRSLPYLHHILSYSLYMNAECPPTFNFYFSYWTFSLFLSFFLMNILSYNCYSFNFVSCPRKGPLTFRSNRK